MVGRRAFHHLKALLLDMALQWFKQSLRWGSGTVLRLCPGSAKDASLLARLDTFKGVLQLGESSFRGRESLGSLFLLRGAWSWWMSLQILEVPRGFFACLLRRCLNAWGDVYP